MWFYVTTLTVILRLSELAHRQMSENSKCSAFEVITNSLRVGRE